MSLNYYYYNSPLFFFISQFPWKTVDGNQGDRHGIITANNITVVQELYELYETANLTSTYHKIVCN